MFSTSLKDDPKSPSYPNGKVSINFEDSSFDNSHFSSLNEDSKIYENLIRAEKASFHNRQFLMGQLINKQNLDAGLDGIKESDEDIKNLENYEPDSIDLDDSDDFIDKPEEFVHRESSLLDSVENDYFPKLEKEKKNEEEEKKKQLDFPEKNDFKKNQIRLSYIMQKGNFLKSEEGFLKKESPSFFQGWQKRYCKLNDKKFVYYSDETMAKPLGFLDFDLITYTIEEVHKNGIIIEIKIIPKESPRIFRFKSANKLKKDISIWANSIKNHIAQSEGAKRNLVKLSKIPRFWNNDRVSERKFVLKADTLDILLFKGKTIMSKIQRSFTRSEYDHVALILRYGNDDIVLLESTGKLGVGLCSWNSFMKNKWQNLYQKLVFRHLDLPRTDEIIEKLEKFVKIVIGKKYKVSAGKLLQRKSIIKNVSPENYNNKTFFCSELVASAYKALRLLSSDKASSQYWPGSFSSEKNIELNGCKFSEEYLIDFNIDE